MRRVVVTGLGMVSPLGNTLSASWKALLEGQSGIQSYVNDPVLKNDKPFNLALIKDFDYKKWRVPVSLPILSTQVVDSIVFSGVPPPKL